MILLVIDLVLLLIVAVLIIPFNIHIKSKKTGPYIKAQINLLWFFDAFKLKLDIVKQKYSIHIFNKKIIQKTISKSKKQNNKKNKINKKNKAKNEQKKKETFSTNLIHPIIKLTKKLIHTFSINKIYIKLNIGSSNKAETGMITGYFFALKNIAPSIYNHKKTTIIFNPNFNEEQYDYNTKIKISNQIINFIIPISSFIISKPIRIKIINTIFNK